MRQDKKRTSRRRRSQTRLGVTQEVAAPALQLSLAPAQVAWQDKLPRIPSIILAGLLCYVLFQFFGTDQFYVFGATIRGNNRVSAREIYDTAAVEGLNVFFLNRQEVERRVERLPNVKEARVTGALPAVVHISVTERQPAYVWQVGDRTYWLDDEGVVIVPSGPAPDSITFIDADGQARQPGSRVDAKLLEAAREFGTHLPEVKVFQWSRRQGFSFLHADGYPVYLGQPEDLAGKIATLRALTEEFTAQGVRPKYVDLRFEKGRYYR